MDVGKSKRESCVLSLSLWKLYISHPKILFTLQRRKDRTAALPLVLLFCVPTRNIFLFWKEVKNTCKSSLSTKCFSYLNVCAYNLQWLFVGMAGYKGEFLFCFQELYENRLQHSPHKNIKWYRWLLGERESNSFYRFPTTHSFNLYSCTAHIHKHMYTYIYHF